MPKIYYLSTDTETMGFNGPVRLPDGKIIQGCDYYPIVQIAGKLLDKDLNVLTVFNYYIQPTADQMARSLEETVDFHIKNGFDKDWEAADRVTIEEAQKLIYKKIVAQMSIHQPGFVQNNIIPEYKYDNEAVIILHGKSVNFDRTFINCQMPELGMILGHQTGDVSAIRTLMYPIKHLPNRLSRVASTHDALDDVDAAIADHKAILDFMNLVPKLNQRFEYLEDLTKAVLERNKTYITKVLTFLKDRIFKL